MNEDYPQWKEVIINEDNLNLRMAVAAGMKDAEVLIQKILAGTVSYDIVEIMACPGGCIAGGGQPVSYDSEIKAKRRRALKNAGKMILMWCSWMKICRGFRDLKH